VPDFITAPTWRDRLESLGGRRRSAWLATAIAAAAVILAVGYFKVRAPAQIAPPASSGTSVGSLPPSPSASPTPTNEMVFVHVAGAVRRPGLYELPAGARVADAVRAAGGARPAADLDALNLAEPLVDGYKVEVLGRGELARAAPPVAAPSAGGSPTPAALVDINTADQAALETIPGIGPVKAAAILTLREEIGSFETVEQLLDVDGIGPATLESMRPYVAV
jgi:competence protein ComEA